MDDERDGGCRDSNAAGAEVNRLPRHRCGDLVRNRRPGSRFTQQRDDVLGTRDRHEFLRPERAAVLRIVGLELLGDL